MILVDLPKRTSTPLGAKRWIVRCISSTMVMKAGEWGPSLGGGFHSRLECFSFGPEHIGCELDAVPASHWSEHTDFVIIDQVGNKRDLYKVAINHKNEAYGLTYRPEIVMLEDGSVFERYGFKRPEETA